MSAPCPGLDQLHALLDGTLTTHAAEALQAHVSGCEHCQKSLENLTSGGESWAPVAAELKQVERQKEERLRVTIDLIKSDTPEAFRASDLERLNQSTIDIANQLRQQGHQPGAVLVRVMEECLKKLEAGEAVDRAALVAAHPELADQLEACLASLEFIHRVAHPSEGAPTQLGDFRIIREIGRGGMGVVYEAEQISLKRQVALKVLRFGAAPDPEAMQRFQREAETVAALHHTNIVPVFAIGSEQGVHYYAMQLIAGRSLKELCQQADVVGESDETTEKEGRSRNRQTSDAVTQNPKSDDFGYDLIRRNGPISPTTIAHWGLQAAEALAHAHQRGVVHRDIKPSNLILGTDGRIWLTDFGLAKRLDDVTLSLSGALLGTPRYMSPEQASAMHKPVDHRTDIYSLGATLYELVTGRPLFESQSPHVVIAQILSVEPQSPRKLVPDLPRDLETIIIKCLSKDASQRYQSAQALADDLRAFIEGRSIRARRVSPIEHALRWMKHNRKQLVTTIAAVAVTIVAVIGGSLSWRQYDAALSGSLVLKTKEGPLLAEVINDAGELVVPSFTVPNEQPMAVPAGDYRLRVSGRGALSKTARFHLFRTQKLELDVELDHDELLEPQTVHGANSYEFVDLGDGPDLIVLPKSPNETNDDFESTDKKRKAAEPTKLKRLSHRTGNVIWSIDISRDSPDLKEFLPDDSTKTQWWQSTVFGWQLTGQKALKVLRPLPDIDADGTPDLIWQMNQGRCVFAVSGKTGKPLLWLRPESHLQTENANQSVAAVFAGSQIVSMRRGEADESLLVVTELLPDPQTHLREVLLRAVRLRDRETVWRMKLEPHKDNGSGEPAVRVVLVGSAKASDDQQVDQPRLLVYSNGELMLLDASTGTVVGKSLEIIPPSERQQHSCADMQVVDLDDDSQPEVVLLCRPFDTDTALRVLSVSAADGVVSNKQSTRPQWSLNLGHEPPMSDAELAADRDLNGDGVRDLVLVNARTELDCRVFDGRNGTQLWRRRIEGHYSEARNSAPLVGADLNGDGCPEVFVMSVKPDGDFTMSNGKHWLYADCFSGKDGRSLWWSRQSIAGRASPFLLPFEFQPQWWEHGPHGGPTLLVSVFTEPEHRQESRLWTIDARNGQFLETATGLTRPELIDWNNDGRTELTAFAMNAPSHNHFDVFVTRGELKVFRGSEPTQWRRFGSWSPLSDIDGDGISELWQPNHRWHTVVPIISGKDGTPFTTWQWEHDVVQRTVPLASIRRGLPAKDAAGDESATKFNASRSNEASDDLDRDGWPDLLAYGGKSTSYSDQGIPDELPLGVSIVSGKRGSLLWSHPLVKAPQWGKRNWLIQHPGDAQIVDLEGDGQRELVVPYVWETASNHQPKSPGRCNYEVAVLDLATGRLKWQCTLFEEAADNAHTFWSDTETFIRFLDFADLDGDGLQDFAVSIEPSSWHSRAGRPRVVQARSGRDGKLLWPEVRGKFQRSQYDWNNFLEATVANVDGKGSPEVVLLDFLCDEQSSEQAWKGEFELLVLDGATGKARYRNHWEGDVDRNGNSAFPGSPRLLTLRQWQATDRDHRDAIVVTKATKSALQYQRPIEDWLLRAPEKNDATELEIVERLVGDREDQVKVVDLENDGIDELVSLRRDKNKEYSIGRDLRATRGLNEVIWSLPERNQHGMRLTVLDAGRVLMVDQHDRVQWISSTGKVLAETRSKDNAVATMNSVGRVLTQFRESFDGAQSNASKQPTSTLNLPRFLTSENNITRNQVMLPIGEDQRRQIEPLDRDSSLRIELPTLTRDPRLFRKLPWVEQDMGQHSFLMLAMSGLCSFIFLVLPLLALRYGWRERRAVWPLVWTVLGSLVWCAGSWKILDTIRASIDGSQVSHFELLSFLMLLVFGYPAASLPALLVSWISERRRRPLVVMTMLMVVSTLGLMGLMLWSSQARLHPSQSYDWSGWYLLMPMGCYGGLCLWMAGDIVRSIWNACWSRSRRSRRS